MVKVQHATDRKTSRSRFHQQLYRQGEQIWQTQPINFNKKPPPIALNLQRPPLLPKRLVVARPNHPQPNPLINQPPHPPRRKPCDWRFRNRQCEEW